jgi:CheY-like chemotaxis protein
VAHELVSLRTVVVSPSANDRAMFRNAAATVRVPIELVESDSETAARRAMAAGADLAFFDMALGSQAVAQMAQAARAAVSPPLTVALCPPGVSGAVPTDGQANRPLDADEARRLIVGSSRLRLPSRVLVVDDSPTMRSIVRKVLAATRFPLEVAEAGEGGEALALARTADFDFVFFDHNLPGLSGLEAIAELRRAKRYPDFVLITSADDDSLAAKAHAHGVAFLKKPFYPADLEGVLCRFCGLRALNPAHP